MIKLSKLIIRLKNLIRPTSIKFKDFNKWEDLGSWNNFNDIGKTF